MVKPGKEWDDISAFQPLVELSHDLKTKNHCMHNLLELEGEWYENHHRRDIIKLLHQEGYRNTRDMALFLFGIAMHVRERDIFRLDIAHCTWCSVCYKYKKSFTSHLKECVGGAARSHWIFEIVMRHIDQEFDHLRGIDAFPLLYTQATEG